MINLRKPLQATIPDGSITATKLADGAVDLGSVKVTGQAPATKIEDGAIVESKIAADAVTTVKIADGAVNDGKLAEGSVIENKIADLAISTGKLKDNVITLAKANDDIKVGTFVGGEEEQAVTGVVETGIIETGFAKVGGKFAPTKLRIIASLKTSAPTGYMKIYIDDEVAARMTLSTVSNIYELVSGEADISDLAAGRHKLVAKIYGSLETTIVSNDYIDVLFVK